MNDPKKTEEINKNELTQLRRQVDELRAYKEKFISEQKQARRLKERGEFIFQFSPSAVFTTDCNRIVTSWNSKAENITGYSSSEIIGKQCYLFSERPCKEQCDIFSRDVKKPVINCECTLRRKDGQIIVVSKSADVLKDENGDIIGAVELFEDISRRNQAEYILEQSHQNLEEVVEERMAQISKINEKLMVEILERERIKKRFEESNEKLQRVLEETIAALAYAVEKRDPYTAGHQQRVTKLVQAIAKEMKISDDKIAGVSTAAMIHDIGKIYVPAEILSKPSKLTEFEFNMITAHPQVGYDILKGIEFPWPVATIVLQHHERMNGSGYPNKLKGEEILLESRILVVADVVEAMASHRPYRPALGIDKAIDEIISKKGILYDVNVVNACVDVFMRRGFRLEEAK